MTTTANSDPQTETTDQVNVLVVNTGSSSVKFKVVSLPGEQVLVSGSRDRVGISGGDFSSHSAAIADILATLPKDLSILVVGHRVVHGGAVLREPTLIDDAVIAAIEALSPLAPLHNPANLEGIRASMAVLPGVPQVAVCDTAFFHTLQPPAYRYAIPRQLADGHSIRRYGFHGTSHQFVSQEVSRLSPSAPSRVITVHLGNGSSVTAIRNGSAIDTSMGFTPLQGLVMGTRSGDIDPGVVVYLQQELGMSADEVDELLNRESGLMGLSGSSDMRDVFSRAENGDEIARETIAIWAWRVRHYIGAYLAQLGGLDALVFTGGIGENQPKLRALCVQGMEDLGISLEPSSNDSEARDARIISSSHSPTQVWVIPTNEELQIARLSSACVSV